MIETVIETMSICKNILIDADGVLTDFLSAFLTMANEVTGLKVTPDDVRDWSILKCYPEPHHKTLLEKMGWRNFCAELPVRAGAKEAVTELRTMGDVYCVTSPYDSQTWAWERTQWLKRHLGFEAGQVLHAEAKHLVRGAVLIDDKYDTLVKWSKENPIGQAILVDAPYNASIACQEDIHRAKTWDDVLRVTEATISYRVP